jgi:hypothetical protein
MTSTRIAVALLGPALLLAGCDIFLPSDWGTEGSDCTENRHCREDQGFWCEDGQCRQDRTFEYWLNPSPTIGNPGQVALSPDDETSTFRLAQNATEANRETSRYHPWVWALDESGTRPDAGGPLESEHTSKTWWAGFYSGSDLLIADETHLLRWTLDAGSGRWSRTDQLVLVDNFATTEILPIMAHAGYLVAVTRPDGGLHYLPATLFERGAVLVEGTAVPATHGAGVTAVAAEWTPAGETSFDFYTASDVVKRWQLSQPGMGIEAVEGMTTAALDSPIVALAALHRPANAEGCFLAAITEGSTEVAYTRCIDGDTWEPISIAGITGAYPTHLAFVMGLLAIGDSLGGVHFYCLGQQSSAGPKWNEYKGSYSAFTGTIQSMVASPEGKRLAVAGEDGGVVVWEVDYEDFPLHCGE